MSLTLLDNVIIIGFFAGMLYIGYFFSKKISSMENFYLAGRSMPWSLAVGTLVATWYGASGTIAGVEYGFVYGVSVWFSWDFLSHITRIPMALWVGPRVHMSTGLTVPDMLHKFYGKAPALIGGVLLFFYCSVFYEVTALGIVGEGAWHMKPVYLMVIIVVISVLLAMSGGLMSVAVTDMLQFWFMCVGLTIVLPFAWYEAGGWAGINSALATQNLDPSFLKPIGGMDVWMVIVLVLLALCAYADPTMYQRFSAADSPKSARRALLCALIIWVTFDAVLVSLGILTKVNYPDLAPGVGYITMTLNYLPIGIQACFIIGVLGAIVTTLDSYYLTGGATLANDIIGRLKKEPLSEKANIMYSRIGAIMMGVIGLVLSTKFSLVADGWVWLGSTWVGCAVVPIVGGIFWPWKRTYWGGLLSMLAGIGASTYLYFYPVEGVGALVFALPASLIAFIIGNMFGENKNVPEKEVNTNVA